MALEEIKEKFKGKWQLHRSENFDEFLCEVGVNFLLRQMAKFAKPTQELVVEGNVIRMTNQSSVRTTVTEVKLDEEVTVAHHGSDMKVKTRYEDGKLILEQSPVGDGGVKAHTVQREVNGDELLMTIHIGDVVCKRWFKKIQT